MKDELNQKISQFLDNELHTDDALDLLQRMRSDVGLTKKLIRYEAIGYALKTDQFLPLRADFSQQISAQLESEPVFLLPRKKPSNRTSHSRYRWLALAASVAVVSVLAVRPLPDLSNHTAQTLQVAQQQAPKTMPPPSAAVKQPESEQPLNARINDYLQAHNGSVYANNPNLKSMAHVTTYNQK